MEPLTIVMTEEQLRKKKEQQRAKAPPPGTSRILSKAQRDQKNKNKQQAEKIVDPGTKNKEGPPAPTHAAANNKNAVPIDQTKAVKKVDTNSSEEFQNLLDEIYNEKNIEVCKKMMQDESFLKTINAKLVGSIGAMMEGRIEGASIYRELCKLIDKLLSIDVEFDSFDDDEGDGSTSPSLDTNRAESIAQIIVCLEGFTRALNLPVVFINLMKNLLNNQQSSHLKSVRLFLHTVSPRLLNPGLNPSSVVCISAVKKD
jgi:hypothetical protein